jgi:hypothetical protein
LSSKPSPQGGGSKPTETSKTTKDMDKNFTISDLEARITSIIGSHRETAFTIAEEEMYKAFGEIADLLKDADYLALSQRKLKGISTRTVRRIALLRNKGITDFKAARTEGTINEETNLNYMIEFLKVRSLTFEATRIKYPNYLKPWTVSDDLELERLWCEGVKEEELARMFKRNIGAIHARIEKLELLEKYGEVVKGNIL